MIETVMIFALGFLTAALLATLIVPAVNSRAERLARRRVEALFPLSITELTAEKDHLRAEFAVIQRRLERKVDETLATKQADMEELGRRALRIEALLGDIEARDARIEGLKADLADTRQRLAATEADLAATREALAETRATFVALETAHSRTLDELGATRGELEATTTALAETRTALAATRERLEARDAAYADLDARHGAALTDIDARRITISDLETRLVTQSARADEFERVLGERRAELATERQRLAEIAKSLVAEQERGLVLEQRIITLEMERDGKAAVATGLDAVLADLRAGRDALAATLEAREVSLRELQERLAGAEQRLADAERADRTRDEAHAVELRALTDRIEILKAEKAALAGALAAARDEGARLLRDMSALRREAGEGRRAEPHEAVRRIGESAEEMPRAAEPGPKDTAQPAARPASAG